jgi:hypothetical protein
MILGRATSRTARRNEKGMKKGKDRPSEPRKHRQMSQREEQGGIHHEQFWNT